MTDRSAPASSSTMYSAKSMPSVLRGGAPRQTTRYVVLSQPAGSLQTSPEEMQGSVGGGDGGASSLAGW